MRIVLLSKKVFIKWNPRYKRYYEDLGYIFTKNNDEFEVTIEHLLSKSNVLVEVKCDYQEDGCKDIYYKKYSDYKKNNINSTINKDCCKNPMCMKIKRKESLLEQYDVENANQIESAKEKRIKTCFEKYGSSSPLGNKDIWRKINNTNLERFGVDHISKSEKIKSKKASTFMKRFGVDNPLKSEKVQEKLRNTNMERYGTPYYTQTDEYRNKTRETNLSKYGAEWSLSSPIVRNKILNSLYSNGTAPASIQQKYINNLIGGELNYPVGRSFLDISYPKEMIYIEYDGGGHWLSVDFKNESVEDFNSRNTRRWFYLYSLGWREIRIISRKDLIPSDEKLLEMLAYARSYLNTGRHYIKFDIDDGKVITSQFDKEYDFGKLRKINKKDIERPSNSAI